MYVCAQVCKQVLSVHKLENKGTELHVFKRLGISLGLGTHVVREPEWRR